MRQVKENSVDGKSLRWAIGSLEKSPWNWAGANSNRNVANALRTLYAAQSRLMPQGYLLPTAQRQAVIDSLDKTFSAFTSEELSNARRLLTDLGGDRSVAPILRESAENSHAPRSPGVLGRDGQVPHTWP